MTLHWKHLFNSAKADGVDSTLIKPSDWNAEHSATTDVTTGIVVGRSVGAAGPLEELPASYDPVQKIWNLFLGVVTGAFRLPTGTSGQRPTGVNGQIRYNTDTGAVEFYSPSGWVGISALDFMKPGMVQAWAGGTVGIPSGWFLCNGQAISRTWPLFNIITTTYGGGDGSTTFNVPNYTDCVLVGAGNVYALNALRGNFSYNMTLTGSQIPLHRHNITPFEVGADHGDQGTIAGHSMTSLFFSITQTDLSGGGDPLAIQTEQPGKGVFWIIKG